MFESSQPSMEDLKEEMRDFYIEAKPEGEDLLQLNVRNDFPSICDFDPNEICERKEIRNNAIEVALGTPVTFEENTDGLLSTEEIKDKDFLLINNKNLNSKMENEEKPKDELNLLAQDTKSTLEVDNKPKILPDQEYKSSSEEEAPLNLECRDRLRFSKKNDSGNLSFFIGYYNF